MIEVQSANLQLVEDYLEWKAEVRRVAWRTVARYRYTLAGSATRRSRGGIPLVEFVGDQPVWELSFRQLKEFIQLPVFDGDGEHPPSASTRANKQAAVKDFFIWMRDERDRPIDRSVVQYSPDFFRDQVRGQAVPKPVRDGIWRQLWHSDDVAINDRVWLGQAYFLGFRVGEIASIQPDDVDVQRGVMNFVRKGGKYARLNYGEVLDDDLRPHLAEVGPFDEWQELFEDLVHCRQRDGDTFLSPQTVGEKFEDPDDGEVRLRPRMADITWYNKRLRKILRVARLDPRSFTPHQLRHSCGTNLWRAGVRQSRLMRIMNHANFNTTLGYAEVSAAFDRQRQRNMHEALSDQRQDI